MSKKAEKDVLLLEWDKVCEEIQEKANKAKIDLSKMELGLKVDEDVKFNELSEETLNSIMPKMFTWVKRVAKKNGTDLSKVEIVEGNLDYDSLVHTPKRKTTLKKTPTKKKPDGKYSRLTQNEKDIILEMYNQGYTCKETAERIKRPAGTVSRFTVKKGLVWERERNWRNK